MNANDIKKNVLRAGPILQPAANRLTIPSMIILTVRPAADSNEQCVRTEILHSPRTTTCLCQSCVLAVSSHRRYHHTTGRSHPALANLNLLQETYGAAGFYFTVFFCGARLYSSPWRMPPRETEARGMAELTKPWGAYQGLIDITRVEKDNENSVVECWRLEWLPGRFSRSTLHGPWATWNIAILPNPNRTPRMAVCMGLVMP